jgi:CMP-N-acetylneuraminic acid synthetase
MIKKKIIAIIPARGGSKGIPRKNIRNLVGKPLIAYTISAAKNSKLINRVLVSTEDEEIAKIARRYGVEIIKRPQELAGDLVPSTSVLKDAVEQLERKENYMVFRE